MAGIVRVHGGVGEEGVINGVTGTLVGASLKFFNIQLANIDGPIDLDPEMAPGSNGGMGGVVESVLRMLPSGIMAYYVPVTGGVTTGTFSVIVDGHAAPQAVSGSATQPGLQEMIQGLGTVHSLNTLTNTATYMVSVSSSTVTTGTGFTVF